MKKWESLSDMRKLPFALHIDINIQMLCKYVKSFETDLKTVEMYLTKLAKLIKLSSGCIHVYSVRTKRSENKLWREFLTLLSFIFT